MRKKATEPELPVYCMICKTSGPFHSHRLFATPVEVIRARLEEVRRIRGHGSLGNYEMLIEQDGEIAGLEFALRALGVEP